MIITPPVLGANFGLIFFPPKPSGLLHHFLVHNDYRRLNAAKALFGHSSRDFVVRISHDTAKIYPPMPISSSSKQAQIEQNHQRNILWNEVLQPRVTVRNHFRYL